MGRNTVSSHTPVTGACHLCGSTELQHLLDGVDRLHGTAGIFPVVQCRNCSLAFIHPQPPLQDIPGFYPKFYYAYVAEETPAHGFFKRMELQFRQRKKAEILTTQYGYPRTFPKHPLYSFLARAGSTVKDTPQYVEGGTLLDIGCGKGTYLLEMQQLGWITQGVEFSQGAVDVARQAGLNVFCGTLAEADIASGAIDYARMADVLEHLPTPLATLKEVYRILKPGGRLQVSVPNIRSLTFRLFGKYWFPLEIPRHLFFYTPSALQKICREAGFEVKELQIWSDKVVDFEPSMQYWLQDKHPAAFRFFERNKWALKLLRKAFSPVKWLANRVGYGSAMTIIVRKTDV